VFETAFAQVRFSLSMALGLPFHRRSLERLLEAMHATRAEFGGFGTDAGELISGPVLDRDAQRELQARRFGELLRRAREETVHYGRLFEHLDIDPGQISHEDIASLPLTDREALMGEPDAFVRRGTTPALRASTTGTTGRPASVYFSERELASTAALTALTFLHTGRVEPEDLVVVALRTRSTAAALGLAEACSRVGAPVDVPGVIDPARMLGLLSERRSMGGKRARVSVLATYPSYLGELVDSGIRAGWGPSDFGLRRIMLGGEIATAGLRSRVERVFGRVEIEEAYGSTEIAPFGGTRCAAGHLHFQASGGLLELRDLQSAAAPAPGDPGTIVATPFPPFRDATVLLRYDTGDVAIALDDSLDCDMAGVPATSEIQGRLSQLVRHDEGWTFPRQVLEALEALDAVPLPARYGTWAVPGGVAVEVVTESSTAKVRRDIEGMLGQSGVPLRELWLCEHSSELRHPRVLRCDHKEARMAPVRGVTARAMAARSQSEAA
jgi:phenylacetate-CoA ligase